jgi:hypothetical protein
VIRDIIKLYPMWDLHDPDSYDRFVDAVTLLAQNRAVNSAALAARYYEMFKTVDLGLTWGKAIALAEPPSRAAIQVAIDATAKAGVYRALSAGKSYDQALANGLVQVTGAVSRHVLNAGRDTITQAVQDDRYFHGWIRVSDGDPCAFCAMLLSRGPVYNEDSADFQSHDHCACSAEPWSDGSKWPEANEKLRDLWNATATTEDPLQSFRRAIEGRE